ncbi:hypothetical protein ANANG_G00235560 [Anguilla anguilla]|uniref:Myb/SANT-like DNA-binding domain-containing protein 4 n=1 Tax=Anguilla anguilla TaxID=7936 RepID=A0A9D3RNF2_ANGAN|nr:hypothetical protein ANANG_G00235560 [Anguilla anguilla]
MKHLKRKRKSNYSVKETQTLIREIHKRKDILFSRQQNTAINELKRRAWDEVADCVNALGEGELRTAAEVKRRYLDWRALMKRKQIRAELSGLKNEYNPSSPDNDNSLSGDQSLDLSGFPKDSACDWQDLSDLGEPSSHTSSGIKMEDEEANSYRLEGEGGEGEGEAEGEEEDEDCFPSILPDMEREGRVPEVFAHIDEFGGAAAAAPSSKDCEKDRKPWAPAIDLEAEKLKLEKERLQLEKERLQFFKFESGRLQIEKERFQVEKERLQLQKDGQQIALHQGH